jgi:hypothetical protein
MIKSEAFSDNCKSSIATNYVIDYHLFGSIVFDFSVFISDTDNQYLIKIEGSHIFVQ